MSTTTRLWQLSEIIKELEEAIALIQEDDTISDEQRETQLEQAFTQWLQAGDSWRLKAEQVAVYIRHQEALVTARKAEAKRIRTLAEQAENQVTRLRRYLTNEMLRVGESRIDSVRAKIGLRKKPPRVLLKVSPEELPPEYVRVTYTPKLTEIKAWLKSHPDTDWALMSESHEYSVTIR